MNTKSSAEQRIDPTERVELLLHDLRTSRNGLSTREARRRLLIHGRNELEGRKQASWPQEVVHQLTHPLALLLWGAAALALVAGIVPVAAAIVVVILINAAFAIAQEMQAERAVETLKRYLPDDVTVVRDGEPKIGTAFAVRTERASLRSVGVFSNRYLLAAMFVYAPPMQALLGTAALPVEDLLIMLPFPFIVWGADEMRRYLRRRAEHTPVLTPSRARA